MMARDTHEVAVDRLVHLELEQAHGEQCPDLVEGVCDRLDGRSADASPGRGRGLLAAAVLLGGVAVVWSVATSAARSTSGTAAQSAADGSANILQDPRRTEVPDKIQEPTVVDSLEGLRAVSADCRALRWVNPTFAPVDLGRLRELRSVHFDCQLETRGEASLLSGDDALRMLRSLPKLLSVRLEKVGPLAELELSVLSAVPNLRRLELVGGAWSGALAGLRRLPGLAELAVLADRLSNVDMAQIRALEGLRRLRLDAVAEVDPAELRATIAALGRLESLRMWDTSLDVGCIDAILAQSSIVDLKLVLAHATDRGFLTPIFAERRWRRLCLGYGGGLDEEDLEGLAAMSSLESLSLGGASTLLHHWVPPEAFWHVLRDMRSVKSIDFSLSYNIESKHLVPLAGMKLDRVVLQLPAMRFAADVEAEIRHLFPAVKDVVLTESARMGGRKGDAASAFSGRVVGLGGGAAAVKLPEAQRKRIEEFEKKRKAFEAEKKAREKKR